MGDVRDISDHEFANYLAEGVGRIARGTRIGGLLKGHALARVANGVAHEWAEQALRINHPDDAMLSEDTVDDLRRLDCERVWILDVIDGTKEFSTGRGDWAVHVALTVNGKVTASAVGMPDAKRVFRSDHVEYVDGPMSGLVCMSRNRPPLGAAELAEQVGRKIRPMGSAGAKTMSVLLGDCDAYVHAGGQYEWDQAAPAGVALAAGLHVSDFDGNALQFNNKDTWRSNLLVCRPEIAEEMLAACQAMPPQERGKQAAAAVRDQ